MKIKLSQLRRIIRETVNEAARAPEGAPSSKCPYSAGTSPEEISKYSMGVDALLRRVVRSARANMKHPINQRGFVVDSSDYKALLCYTDSYDEAREMLASAGLTPEEAQTVEDEGAPGTESYFYRSMKPWIIYLAEGGTCQHKGGHLAGAKAYGPVSR